MTQRFDGPLDLGDPAWFLDQLDIESAEARFVKTDRDDLSRQAFLDPRWNRSRFPATAVPGSTLDAPEGRAAKLNFVWHTSFCCSTVIAALLDRPGLNLCLKEPRALVDLADLKRRQQGALKRPGLGRAVFGLYARRFGVNEQILIKPSNFANNLIFDAAAMTEGRMLMLYSSCRSFLASILKAGEDRKAYVRDLFIALAADGHSQGGWPVDKLLRLSDLQVAALVWQMQMANMRGAMTALGERAVSLDGDAFLDAPSPSLEALDRFFGLGFGAAEIAAVASGPALTRDVKTGREGAGKARRQAEAEGVERQMAHHLDQVIAWAAEASQQAETSLPRPLL